jgi:signal transduction histidine kinase
VIVFSQELSAYPLQALLDQAEEDLGSAEQLAEILARYDVTRADIAESTDWVSLEFVDALIEDIVARLGDPGFVARAAVRGVQRKYLGPIFPLIVRFGSPTFLFKSFPSSSARLDKLGVWVCESRRPGQVRLTWTAFPHIKMTRFLCEMRRHQLAYGPSFFGKPRAHIEHPECAAEGGKTCTYYLSWDDKPFQATSPAVIACGAAAGAALAYALAAPLWAYAVLAGVFGTCTWALAKLRKVEHDAALNVQTIEDQHVGLERFSKKNEERYLQLLEAKAEVDTKVEQRTEELRLATQQLSETLAQVRELDRAKTSFFANVSHDLRTPLTLILGPLGEMASGREPPGGLPRAVDVMQRNGLRLLELINQLLDLAKIDAGKLQIARAPIDVVELARSVETRFAGAATQRNLALRVLAPEVAPIWLDSAWIDTALTNLLANALRYARSHVEIAVRESEGSVLLEVHDDGPGIAEADLGAVFDRFAQGSDIQTRKGSTGLGLAIVREAARLHGGDAFVRSELGVATTFTLALPRVMPTAGEGSIEPTPSAHATMPARLERISSPPRRVPDRIDWPGPSANAPLILLVEDDDDLRGFIGEVLAVNYRVRACQNGEQALALIEHLRPDTVVSDVVMPIMDGFELCRRLRKNGQTAQLPVILLTARRDVGRVLEGFEAGADDYVTKPFQARELLARVSVHVRLRRMVSEMAHRERLASLGVLAASLAHQVRNPLAAIVSGLPAVRKRLAHAIDHRDDEMFEAMIDSGERIHTLVNDLMDLSRVDQETVARLRPAQGVRACVRLIEARLQGSVQIETDLDDALELEGRPGDLSHVFLNLIDNAVRAAGDGGRVFLRVVRRGELALFESEDSGPGIPPEAQEAVFAPFYTTRRPGEGTGLGLAIARQVVLQHGGTISVGRSALGGALLTVSLPLATVVAAASADRISITVH